MKMALFTFEWSEDTERIIHLLKDSVELKIFTPKNLDIAFTDSKVEIFQILDLKNPLNIFTILPLLVFNDIQKIIYLSNATKWNLKTFLASIPGLEFKEININDFGLKHENKNLNFFLEEASDKKGNIIFYIPYEIISWTNQLEYFFNLLLKKSSKSENHFLFFIHGWGPISIAKKNIWRMKFKNYLNTIYIPNSNHQTNLQQKKMLIEPPKGNKNKIFILFLAGVPHQKWNEFQLLTYLQNNFFIICTDGQSQLLRSKQFIPDQNIFILRDSDSEYQLEALINKIQILAHNNQWPNLSHQNIKDSIDNQILRLVGME